MKRRAAFIVSLWISAVTLQGGCSILGDPAEIHDPEKASKNTRQVRLITYNIHYAVGLDKQPNRREILDIVRPYDVICLNEAPRQIVEWLAGELDMSWISADRSPYGDLRHSPAVLSKIPIKSSQLYRMPVFMWVAERRTIIEAKLDNGLTVFAMHSGLIPVERDIHLACAKKILDRCPGPRVLCGDLNCAPTWKAIQGLRRDYKDVGTDKTHQTFPRLRIDYILASDGVEIRDLEVGQSKASDHLPVSAILDLK